MSELSKNAYARCKACNKSFYPKWKEKFKVFEDLCWRCLPKSEIALVELEQDKALLSRVVQEHDTGVHGDLALEDEYTKYSTEGEWFGMGTDNPFD